MRLAIAAPTSYSIVTALLDDFWNSGTNWTSASFSAPEDKTLSSAASALPAMCTAAIKTNAAATLLKQPMGSSDVQFRTRPNAAEHELGAGPSVSRPPRMLVH